MTEKIANPVNASLLTISTKGPSKTARESDRDHPQILICKISTT